MADYALRWTHRDDPARFRRIPRRGVAGEKNGGITNTGSEVIFLHDFDLSEDKDFIEQLPTATEKYSRRLDRWRKVVTAGDPVLFVRGSQNAALDVSTENQARALYGSLVEAYPCCDVHVLVVNSSETGIEPQQIGKISMDNVTVPVPFTWQGDDTAWSEMFTRHTA